MRVVQVVSVLFLILVSTKGYSQTMRCQDFFDTNHFVSLKIYTIPPEVVQNPAEVTPEQYVGYKRQLKSRLIFRRNGTDESLDIGFTNIESRLDVNYGAYGPDERRVAFYQSLDEMPGNFVVNFINPTMGGITSCRCTINGPRPPQVNCDWASQ